MGSKTETKRIDDNVEVTSIESFRWAKFNYNIRYKLCSGKDAYYKYIDCCSYLQHNGWISRDKVGGGYDGVHYSHNTYLRIYDYCIKNINK